MSEPVYRKLGSSNILVSRLCLGSMMFGGATSAEDSKTIIHDAWDNGINFIDTADVYNQGESERVVGSVIKHNRPDWVLASKIGNAQVGSSSLNKSRYSRQWIIRGVEESLQRLDTDYLDILYLHRDFYDTNLEETVRALGNLIDSGKIRSFGLSNFRGWRIAEIIRICKETNTPQPVVIQPYYNLLNRGPEVEILPASAHYGLGIVPYSPIARGVLTGKYKPGLAPEAGSRLERGDRRIIETEFRAESLEIAQKIVEHARQRGITPGQFAVAWVLANPLITSVIAGPRTLEQLRDYYPAVNVQISQQEEDWIDSLVTPGHTSTHGFNDPSYPFFGRKQL